MTVFSDDVAELDDGGRELLAETIEVARRVDGVGVPGAARTQDLLDGEFPTRVLVPNADTATLAVLEISDSGSRTELAIKDLSVEPLLVPPVARLGSKVPSVKGGQLDVSLSPHESQLIEFVRDVPLVVFCDFDGTFSVQDVGSTLAQRHAGEGRPAVWSRYESGEITAWEYNMEVLDGLHLPKTVVDEFLHTVELDPGARDLLSWCEARGVPFRILSDGFDANLNRLQQIHGVRFAYEANHLRYDRGTWRLAPGFPNPACGCGTGTCKSGRIAEQRALRPDAVIVHIGNGRVSDLCGALAADVAFAKDSLATVMQKRGAPFEAFETLADVIPTLESVLEGRLPGDSRDR
jgi:2,3-diketo-5-methylthio-1-phosphopentane phosphatase